MLVVECTYYDSNCDPQPNASLPSKRPLTSDDQWHISADMVAEKLKGGRLASRCLHVPAIDCIWG